MKLKALFKEAISAAYDKKSPFRSILYKIIRILYLSFTSFHRNELYLKSSLLTFYSLISIVPILAIILSIAKGFGFDEFLQKQLLLTFKEQRDILTNAFQFSSAIIGHIKNQAIVGLGAGFLFFSVFGLFENIEKALNTIWNVKKKRGIVRKWINYVMALIFFPVIFIASTSITIFINSEIIQSTQNYEFLKSVSTYALMLLKWAPFALMCALFSYIYIFTPNAKISIKPRIFAGIIAGAFFQFWQIIYIDFQLYISSYNVIYGSFAALPLFLVWMQVNFMILLFGAEIAAHIEGDRFFKKNIEEDCFKLVNQKQLCLMVLFEITSRFLKGKRPLSINHISENLGISSLDAREVLNMLERAGIIAEIRSSEKYQLMINPELFTIQSIDHLLEKTSLKKIFSKETILSNTVSNCFLQFEHCIKNSSDNLNLKDFATLKGTKDVL